MTREFWLKESTIRVFLVRKRRHSKRFCKYSVKCPAGFAPAGIIVIRAGPWPPVRFPGSKGSAVERSLDDYEQEAKDELQEIEGKAEDEVSGGDAGLDDAESGAALRSDGGGFRGRGKRSGVSSPLEIVESEEAPCESVTPRRQVGRASLTGHGHGRFPWAA